MGTVADSPSYLLSPSPSSYSPPRPRGVARSSFGVQTDSRKSTGPLLSFSAIAGRDAAAKVFISERHIQVENSGRLGAPAKYNLPGAIDKQPEASKRTSPAFSFPHTQRPLGANSSVVAVTPGPGAYTALVSLGPQTISSKETNPRAVFGTSDREHGTKQFICEPMLGIQKGTQGADPGRYMLPGSVGPQPSSTKRSGPAYSLPHQDRLRNEHDKLSRSLPAPGEYQTWNSLGKQTLSTQTTVPAWAWAKGSAWGNESKRFISPEHMKERTLTESPGFGCQNGQSITSFGRQTLSSRTTTPRTTFGSATRGHLRHNNTPGPGAYD